VEKCVGDDEAKFRAQIEYTQAFVVDVPYIVLAKVYSWYNHPYMVSWHILSA